VAATAVFLVDERNLEIQMFTSTRDESSIHHNRHELINFQHVLTIFQYSSLEMTLVPQTTTCRGACVLA
jgi:hypothetical protein